MILQLKIAWNQKNLPHQRQEHHWETILLQPLVVAENKAKNSQVIKKLVMHGRNKRRGTKKRSKGPV